MIQIMRASYPIFPTLHQHILLAMDLRPDLKKRKDGIRETFKAPERRKRCFTRYNACWEY